jgi:hypothetical protein
MKSLIAQFSLYLLVVTVIYIGALDKRAFSVYRMSEAEKMDMPRLGSFAGINAKGILIKADANRADSAAKAGYLVAFVIHHTMTDRDINYWNRVIALSWSTHHTNGPPVQYWGICDDGMECSSGAGKAMFNVVGYIDAYQMHIMALADSGHSSLIYNKSMLLVGHPPLLPDPSDEAKSIQQWEK